VDDVFLYASWASYTWHLSRNREKHHGKECARVVKRMAHAHNDVAVERAGGVWNGWSGECVRAQLFAAFCDGLRYTEQQMWPLKVLVLSIHTGLGGRPVLPADRSHKVGKVLQSTLFISSRF